MQSFAKTIELVNVVISMYSDELLGDVQCFPSKVTSLIIKLLNLFCCDIQLESVLCAVYSPIRFVVVKI